MLLSPAAHPRSPSSPHALDSLRAIHLSERSAPVQAAADASHPAGVSFAISLQ
ncbi:MAG: hypothetical protein WDO13_14220 [Verrucomicrobiota bacterium]